ncbi:MAG TPA: hypothetical protein VGR26_18470 [Acidimicrobiales bacterium]|nr:hypothetical protein [Acidimicrobiales bacterium]
MESLLYLLPVLACGLMMALMMFFLARLMKPRRGNGDDDRRKQEVASLREEVRRLSAGKTAERNLDG